jgi:hypothetical protein
MKPELLYLVYATILTGLLWIPYVLDRFATWGISDTVGYPEAPKPQSPWAARMKKAHANAVTAGAAMAYFWGRVVHVLAYTFAVPWLRTLGFTVGFFAQAAIAWQILAR